MHKVTLDCTVGYIYIYIYIYICDSGPQKHS